MLIASCSPTEQRQKNVCTFFINDELVVLNGNVKHMVVEYESRTNPGEDYDIIDINRKRDVTKIIHGFHGMILPRTYLTNYDKNGRKLETISYLIIPKNRTMKDIFIKKIKEIDSIKEATAIYTYNNENEIIRTGFRNTKTTDETMYKYNSTGDLVETDGYGWPEITFYKYDDQHHLIESNRYIRGHFWGKSTYKYLSFDLHNNWTKAIQVSKNGYESSGKAFTINRKITYY